MQNKVRLGPYIVEMLKKGTAKVRLGSYIVQKAKIRHDWRDNLFKMLK